MGTVGRFWVIWSVTLSLIPTPSTAWLKLNFKRVWPRKWVFLFPKLLVKGYCVSHGGVGSHYFLYVLTLSAEAEFLVSGWEVRNAIAPLRGRRRSPSTTHCESRGPNHFHLDSLLGWKFHARRGKLRSKATTPVQCPEYWLRIFPQGINST